MRNTYLVTYDICDDKRLRTVFKTMRDFGDHLQYSVFECQLTPSDLARCRHDLGEIINHREDQVLFVDLGLTDGRGDRVITAVNTKAVTPESFITAGNAVNLTPAGRKAFLRTYEHRMDSLATHPLFGYRVNYRRLLEIQARLLGRMVTGELPSYRGFETR